MWASVNTYGPELQGELTVTRNGSAWRAQLATAETRFTTTGDSVRFSFASDIGQFRGVLENNGKTIRGFWIQPKMFVLGQAFATPLTLRLQSANRWQGDVVPLADRYSLYINFWRNSRGMELASFRNPELNDRMFTLVYEVTHVPDSVVFSARPDTTKPEVRFAASYDSVRKQMVLFWPPQDRTFLFAPRSEEQAIEYFPRVPRSARYAYAQPPMTSDGWTTAAARDVGFEEDKLAGMVQSLADTLPTLSRFPAVHSLLIARKGKLVLEEYFAGYSRERTHDVRSIGKSFSNVMLGAAMLQGVDITPETKIATLTQALTPFAQSDARKQRITLAHLMTHSSGLACDDNEDTPGNEGTMQSQSAQPNWWKYTLDLPMTHEPGEYWAYCSATMNLMGAALTSATHTWLPELFNRTIARPLQFGRYYYNLMPNGEGYLGGGAWLRPRDLLKIGQLYMNGGVWNGRRIVSNAWVATSTSKQMQWDARGENVSAGSDGYAWHLNTLKSGNRTYQEYEANGNGGQLLMVVPELELVVVFTAGNYAHGGIWHWYRDHLLTDVIIPAIKPNRAAQ